MERDALNAEIPRELFLALVSAIGAISGFLKSDRADSDKLSGISHVCSMVEKYFE